MYQDIYTNFSPLISGIEGSYLLPLTSYFLLLTSDFRLPISELKLGNWSLLILFISL